MSEGPFKPVDFLWCDDDASEPLAYSTRCEVARVADLHPFVKEVQVFLEVASKIDANATDQFIRFIAIQGTASNMLARWFPEKKESK